MSNVTNRQWPHAQSPAGWPTTTNAAQPATQPWPTVRMPTVPPAAAEILRDAVWHIDAAEHMASGANAKTVRNLGWGGPVLNARCGSTTVADTNDPLFLPFYGTPYVYLPGTTGNYVSTPDAMPLRVIGDIDLRFFGSLDSATPSANSSLVAKWRHAGGLLPSYYFALAGSPNSGKLLLALSSDGNTTTTAYSSVTVPAIAGPIWMRVTWRASDGRVQFFFGVDGSSWTQLGVDATLNIGSIYANASALIIGSRLDASSDALGARAYRAQVYNGINGTLVFDADTSVLTSGSQTTFVEKSSNAATVTINRATSGRKSVAVVAPVWLFGTDDYMEVRDNPLLNFDSSFSIVAVVRFWADALGDHPFMGKRYQPTASAGFQLQSGSVAGSISDMVIVSDGTALIINSSTYQAGTTRAIAGVFNPVDISKLQAYGNGTALALATPRSVAAIRTPYPFHVGRVGEGSGIYANMEFMSAAIFRRALSASEIATLTAYFQGKYK